MAYSPQATVELLHLILLDLLCRKLDKASVVLKGGCNLRFFMKSCRYSQDMDLDIRTISPEKLQDTLTGIMEGNTLRELLNLRGMSIEGWSAPKQTQTTQRWKFTLAVRGSDTPHPTKVEFSRRGMRAGVEFGAIDRTLIGRYELAPFMVSHYGADEASRQKVEALASRRVTQARDVFDLHLLLAAGSHIDPAEKGVAPHVTTAIENALSMDFVTFRSQVLSYLRPDVRKRYDRSEVWDDIVLGVVRALEGVEA